MCQYAMRLIPCSIPYMVREATPKTSASETRPNANAPHLTTRLHITQ